MILLKLLMLLWIGLCPDDSGDGESCVCVTARVNDAWCDACGAGYLAGLRIPSKRLFEVLDAHGHDYEKERLRCESCQKAIREEGYCTQCRIGFYKNMCYLSRLSYEVARGRRVDPAKVTCETCRKNTGTFGWCEACGVGHIGTIITVDRAGYEAGSQQADRLLKAIARLRPCESCAIAYFTNGYCTTCKKRYRDGSAVDTPGK